MSHPQRPRSGPGGGSGGASKDHIIPQDYIARIRYMNEIPPPPCPPKLLDIPNNAAAQYTDPAFVDRLRRMEPVNVEIDSELGLPLDLLGLPNIFDGDQTALEPMDPLPTVHIRDRPLLRPATDLGKTTARSTGVGAANVFYHRRKTGKNALKRSNAFPKYESVTPEPPVYDSGPDGVFDGAKKKSRQLVHKKRW
ncbi:hypothetical protein RUND412_003360 [Rhizina undulata]